jgi:hypothetical protein
MAQHGRLIIMAGLGRTTEFPVWPFFVRNCSMYGFTVTGTSVNELRSCARQINAWMTNKTLKAKIDQIMPLSEAAQAHRKQEQGRLFGSTLVLTVMVRKERKVFLFALIAFLCIVGTQVVFWTFTYPANRVTNNWTVLPEGWLELRRQWEYSHATGAVLNLVALVALILSVLGRDEKGIS